MNALALAVRQQAERDRSRIEALSLPRNIAALLLDAAAECPERCVADFFEDGVRLTYRELADLMLRQAAAFRKAGIERGSPVVVMLPNCADWIVTWMAIAALGAVIVPVNMRYTGRELAFVVQDSGATHLVIDESVLPALADAALEAVLAPRNVLVRTQSTTGDFRRLDPDDEPLPVADLPDIDADALANIQFTSGSTGTPKGCLLAHRYWLIIGLATLELYDPKPGRILIHKPMFYMDGQVFFILALFARATVFFSARASSSRYLDWLGTYAIDFCGFFPEIVFKQDVRSGQGLRMLRAFTAGWSGDNRSAAQQRYGFPLFEMFGMTEVGGALYVPDCGIDLSTDTTCGVEMPYQSCKVMLDEQREADEDVVGELWVKGPAIFSGYHNRPEANASSFVDGWFRTGDLFRRDARGLFYYSGRTKDMIRRSAENISAQEVEAVLRTLPAVEQAAVIGVPDELRGQEVKAFVVFAAGTDPRQDAAAMDAFFAQCQASLAIFKIPRFVQPIGEMPLTASQKVDKASLRSLANDPRAGCYDRQTQQWIPSP